MARVDGKLGGMWHSAIVRARSPAISVLYATFTG